MALGYCLLQRAKGYGHRGGRSCPQDTTHVAPPKGPDHSGPPTASEMSNPATPKRISPNWGTVAGKERGVILAPSQLANVPK